MIIFTSLILMKLITLMHRSRAFNFLNGLCKCPPSRTVVDHNINFDSVSVIIIILYHNFLPPPRRGSHVKSELSYNP